MQALVSTLPKCGLCELILDSNDIGIEGVSALAQAFPHCSNLQFLSVDHCFDCEDWDTWKEELAMAWRRAGKIEDCLRFQEL